jgi:transcription termination/antitermination protein NusA
MLKIGPALLEHAEQLERERGIPKDVIMSSLKEAMLAAYKRYSQQTELHGFECKLIERTGEIGIYQLKRVVEKVDEPVIADPTISDDAVEDELVDAIPANDDVGQPIEAVHADDGVSEEDVEEEEIDPELLYTQISVKDARAMKIDAEVDDILELDVTPTDFGRIAAQAAKQVIMQRIREAEKLLLIKEFEERKEQMVSVIVQRIEGRNVIVSLGKVEAIMPPKEQLQGEYYRVGNKLRVFVADLRDNGRLPQIIVSQAHAAMVKEVFELEVPEIEDGLVEIKTVAREAGHRTKVAVYSSDPDVDPQGACIGTRGSRIQAIVNELRNEKIDIIRWSEDPIEFIINSLAPARIVDVRLMMPSATNPTPAQRALVIVPDDQLSLAIGREGQNVRLAAKLTGYKLDIKSISQLQEELARVAERQDAAAALLQADNEAYDQSIEATTANDIIDNAVTEAEDTLPNNDESLVQVALDEGASDLNADAEQSEEEEEEEAVA